MKKRRTIAATELRVHLGQALRRLDDEILVIEKGGVPVAQLTRYQPGAVGTPGDAAYERALSRRAQDDAWDGMRAAIARGWARGFDADALIAEIYRRREEGSSRRSYWLDDTDGA